VTSDANRAGLSAANPIQTLKKALDRAAAKVGDRFQDRPLVEAAVRRAIGQAYAGVGESGLSARQLERAVKLCEAYLGPDDAETLAASFSLAEAYQFDQLPEAIALFDQILKKRQAMLGPDHRLTLKTMNSLGEAYRKAGLLDRAAALVEYALARKKATLGLDDAWTANSMHDLGLIFRDSGRYAEAIALLEQANIKLTALNGPDHPDTCYCRANLVGVYQTAGQLDDADRLLRKMAARTENADVYSSGDSAVMRIQLGENLLRQKKPAKAESLLRESLEILAGLNRTGPWKFRTQSMLGEALLDQQQYTAAEPLLLQGYEGLKQRETALVSTNRHWVAEAHQRVVRFYEATNQPEKAREWREKLQEDNRNK
jgi:tetratricopeptide (TPR) repeat protein